MKLYRYRRPQKYLKNEIIDEQICFSPIISMNDFYDGYFQYSEVGDIEKYIEILKKVTFLQAKEILKRGVNKTQIQLNNENHSHKNTLKWAYAILNSPNYFEKSIKQLRFDFKHNPEKIKETIKLQNRNANVMRSNILICCLSKKKLCMSMFGYYAENGTGVMIEYEDVKKITKEINYVDKLPVMTIDKTPREGIEMQVFTKLKSWEHEEEVRTYIYNKTNIQTNHGLKIKGVYLGPRIEKEYAKLVNKWSKKVSIPVFSPFQNKFGYIEWK